MMRRWISRTCLAAAAVSLSGCSAAFLGLAPEDDLPRILVPSMQAEGGASREQAERVAGRLRSMIQRTGTHTVVPDEELSLATRRYKVERLDALTTRQLAQLMGARLATWGYVAPNRGGFRADIEFVEPRSGDKIVLQGVTGANEGQLARNIFLAFRQRLAALVQAATCGELLAAQQFQRALATCDSALAVVPGSSAALYSRATALRKLERFEEAREAYGRTLRANPGHLDALLGSGLVASQLGRLEEAMAAYRQYLELSRGSPRVRMVIANEVAKTGDAVSAYHLLEPALASPPVANDAEVQRFAFAVATAAGQRVGAEQDADAARPYFEAAMSAYERGFPTDSGGADLNTLRQLIAMNHALGRGDEALRIASEATVLHDTVASVWSQYASALADAGRHAEAVEALDRVVELDPDFDDVYIRRAVAALQAGERERALADLDRGAERGGAEKAGMVLYREGVNALRQERFKEASGLLEKAHGYAAPSLRSDLSFYWGYSLYKQGETLARGNAALVVARARRALQLFERALPLLRRSTHSNAPQAVAAAETYIGNQRAVIRAGGG